VTEWKHRKAITSDAPGGLDVWYVMQSEAEAELNRKWNDVHMKASLRIAELEAKLAEKDRYIETLRELANRNIRENVEGREKLKAEVARYERLLLSGQGARDRIAELEAKLALYEEEKRMHRVTIDAHREQFARAEAAEAKLAAAEASVDGELAAAEEVNMRRIAEPEAVIREALCYMEIDRDVPRAYALLESYMRRRS